MVSISDDCIMLIFGFNSNEILEYDRIGKYYHNNIYKYLLPTDQKIADRVFKILSKYRRLRELTDYILFAKYKPTEIVLDWVIKRPFYPETMMVLLKLPEHIFNPKTEMPKYYTSKIDWRGNIVISTKDSIEYTEKDYDKKPVGLDDDTHYLHQCRYIALNRNKLANILLNDNRIDDTSIYSNAMLYSYTSHCGKCMYDILSMPKCKIAIWVVLQCTYHAYKDSARLLLNSGCVDLRGCLEDDETFNETYGVMALYGYDDVIIKFINHTGINIFTMQHVITPVAKYCKVETLQLLIADARCKFSDDYEKALYGACDEYRYENVKLLLMNNNITQIHIHKTFLSIHGDEYGNEPDENDTISINIAKLLLADPRCDPTINNNELLRIVGRKNKFVRRILLSDPRIHSIRIIKRKKRKTNNEKKIQKLN
jgi:hypothetical protein